ncbi:hypothetical protein TRV_00258 [Trichophyton verrucosum HKI 0517]|uniref:Uncharacterized protein n=1 Tax=Trichophyton verrucosum (strain HKI 0517) TaxID=663202 RepID=D4CZL6_TRIVH|nr:uncharacterized protein TRV_00258 [Trichophyton verrucosum HKI 0517]EFE45007.1 hypothetical protein TRV_00258 [Trichophyton verrucosum HKI 0517]
MKNALEEKKIVKIDFNDEIREFFSTFSSFPLRRRIEADEEDEKTTRMGEREERETDTKGEREEKTERNTMSPSFSFSPFA